MGQLIEAEWGYKVGREGESGRQHFITFRTRPPGGPTPAMVATGMPHLRTGGES